MRKGGAKDATVINSTSSLSFIKVWGVFTVYVILNIVFWWQLVGVGSILVVVG